MIWWFLGRLVFAACELDAPADAPFELQRAAAPRAILLVEVWVRDDAQIPWARGVLEVVASRERSATVVVPVTEEGPSAVLAAFLVEVRAAGHEVALHLAASDVPTDVLEPVRPLRKKVRAYEASGRVRTVVSTLAGRGSEALLGKTGFRSIHQLQAAAGATPRSAGQFEGQPRINVVLPPGAYAGDCGPAALVGPFTPRAADRVMAAVTKGLSAGTTTPITRLALEGARAADTDADVLARWLDDVALPAGVTLATPEALRPRVLQGFKSGPVSAEERRASGRLLPVESALAAAHELASLDEIPLAFEVEMNSTELFVALLLVAAEGQAEGSLHLRTLAGPVSQPDGLSEPVPVEPDALRTLARQLLAALPNELPAALPVDGKLLSTGEILTALASLARGDDPVMARPIASPDPHARGLGWGTSE